MAIIQEIKTIYPQLHNIFVKLLSVKYGEQANIAIMNNEMAKEQLNDAELTGQL